MNLNQTINIKSIVNFHLKCLQGIYFSEFIRNNNYYLLFSDLIEDCHYNYVTQINGDINQVIDEVRLIFANRNRKLSLYITPCSYLYENDNLIPKNFIKGATDAWMILDNQKIIKNYKIPESIIIGRVSENEIDEYVHTFNLSYNENKPHSTLPEYYINCLRRSFNLKNNDFQKDYVYAKINNKIVGVALMVSNNEITGIYGIGTTKEYRRKGVATSIIAFLIKQAIVGVGSRIIMLQTEAGSKIEKWYSDIGFRVIFNGEIFQES